MDDKQVLQISSTVIESKIAELQGQYNELESQLHTMDAEYQQKREVGIGSLNQLAGMINGYKFLIQEATPKTENT